MRISSKIKIIIAIVFSAVIVIGGAYVVSNTSLGIIIRSHPLYRSLFDQLDRVQKQKKLDDVANLKYSPELVEVQKGIKTASSEAGTYVQYNLNSIEYDTYTFVVNGKNIKVEVMKGKKPPTQEEVERIFQ